MIEPLASKLERAAIISDGAIVALTLDAGVGDRGKERRAGGVEGAEGAIGSAGIAGNIQRVVEVVGLVVAIDELTARDYVRIVAAKSVAGAAMWLTPL